MMRSLNSGVSGLRNLQSSMDVIGNNISNVNTIGFKSSSVNFQDMLSQTTRSASKAQNGLGGTNPMQVGLGMRVASIGTDFTGGTQESTSSGSDLMLQGDGMFIVKNGSTPFYTRNGAFTFDTSGNLVNSDGMIVQGWQADNTGAVDTTKATTGIKVLVGQPVAAKATTNATFSKNFNSDYTGKFSDAIISEKIDPGTGTAVTASFQLKATDKVNEYSVSVTGANVVSNDMKITVSPAGMVTGITGSIKLGDATNNTVITGQAAIATTPVAATGAAFDALFTHADNGAILTSDATTTADTLAYSQTAHVVSKDIYDSIGEKHTIKYEFENEGNNTWSYWVSIDGNYANADGTMPATPTTTRPATGTALKFDTDGNFISGNVSIAYNPTGASAMNIMTDLSGTTQYASDMSVDTTTDGYEAGTLTGYNIDKSGIVTGEYSNGVNSELGQLAVAVFNNSGGLVKEGGSLYTASDNSGDAQVGVANTGGRGVVVSNALESSNVDLASEFTKMIIAQRAFSANSRIITTSDEMLQELVNLKK